MIGTKAFSPTELALRLHESTGSHAAFRTLVNGVREAAPVHRAWWVGREPAEAWPDEAEPPAGPAARAAGDAGVVLCGPGDPCGEGLQPGTEALVLALGEGLGGVVLVADAGTLGEPPAWGRVRTGLVTVAAREVERDRLLHRAEESEALHILGLAANRTLDPDEVLTLVARFTRTLLGAHYVTVSTREDDHVRTMAAVGLRANDPLLDDDPLAVRVLQAESPLVLGGEHGAAPGEFPFHAAEGMEAGLGVPLALFGSTFGALVVGYRRPYAPTPQDIRLTLTLAGHAAVALSNARLHRALAERSHDLARALDELRETSTAKERFFASMSHELRTPLNGILGYQGLVLEGIAGELPPAAREYLERANRAGRTLLRIVDDVLNYARIEGGRVELNVQPVTVADLVDDAVLTIQPLAGEKALHLVAEAAPHREIHTDAGRVRQILVNLLSNAVKFTPSGGQITVSPCELRRRDGAVHGLEVRVRDTGPGIAPEDQARVFLEFEQVRGTQGGTGLGLPISRKLARLLGGDLTLESRLGEGSTFVLRLPLVAPVAGGTALAR
ncbi:MAG TPA: ATP-binding protein [Longimicrobium sp.]|nr:ATP-binding protein [Longimicrobium sp.]